METMNFYSNKAEGFVKMGLSNPYLMAVIKITLALYAAQIAPNAPSQLKVVFSNTYFKIFAITLILYLSSVDFQLSIILSVVYVLGMNTVSGRNPLESFSDFSSLYKPANGAGKLIEPHTFIYPGCDGITMNELVKAFEGDIGKLQESTVYAYNILLHSGNVHGKDEMIKMARAAGLPYNVDVDKEENAPYIATLLLNAGMKLSDTCQAPHDDSGAWKGMYAKGLVN